MKIPDGILLDLGANEPEFTPPPGHRPRITDEQIAEAIRALEELYRGYRRPHTRKVHSGKVVYVRGHMVRDRPKKTFARPPKKPDRMGHLAGLTPEQMAERRREWRPSETPKPKVVRKKKARPERRPGKVETVHLATLTREERERILHARLRELGIRLGKEAVEVHVSPRSKRHLGWYVDPQGEPHYIKIPTGRRRGRPRKKPPPPEQGPVGARMVREIVDEKTGESLLLIPEDVTRRSADEQARREAEERAWALEIAQHTLPERPAAGPTPMSNLELVLPAVLPAKAQGWVRRRCQEWANVIWQREQSPVRFEVITPNPRQRPRTRWLVGRYQTQWPLRGPEIVFPVVQEWDTEDAPPDLGSFNNGRRYGGALLRRFKNNWSYRDLLDLAAQLSPLFGDELDDLKDHLASGKPLTIRQILAMAIGLQSVDQKLVFEYWQRDAVGDGDGKMRRAVQRAHLARVVESWRKLRLPAEAKQALEKILAV